MPALIYEVLIAILRDLQIVRAVPAIPAGKKALKARGILRKVQAVDQAAAKDDQRAKKKRKSKDDRHRLYGHSLLFFLARLQASPAKLYSKPDKPQDHKTKGHQDIKNLHATLPALDALTFLFRFRG